MKIKMHQRNVRIDAFTCRKVVRCLEDNCRWQLRQLWSPPASSTASSPSLPSPPSSSSPSLSLSNPFSLDHPFFQRHYFRIRSSFYHPPPSAFHQPSLPVLRSIFRQRVTLGRTRGVTTRSTLENFLDSKILGKGFTLDISELPLVAISALLYLIFLYV